MVPVRHGGESTRIRRPPVPGGAVALLALAAWFAPAPAEGQVVQLLRTVGNGGSWINLPVKKGRASFRSPVMPLAGLSVNGCLRVWRGHSGSWTVRARDTVGGQELEAKLVPGTPAKFEYDAGLQAQLDLVVEWSEPRDTTLFMWIGVERAKKEKEKDDRDICQPPPP